MLNFAHSSGKKIIGDPELFERTLVVYFVLSYSRKGSSKKGLIPKFILLRMLINFDMIRFLVFTHTMK